MLSTTADNYISIPFSREQHIQYYYWYLYVNYTEATSPSSDTTIPTITYKGFNV